MKFYKTVAVPTFLYASETWTFGKKDVERIQAAEMQWCCLLYTSFHHVVFLLLLLPIGDFSLLLLFPIFILPFVVPVFAVALLRILLSSDWYSFYFYQLH